MYIRVQKSHEIFYDQISWKISIPGKINADYNTFISFTRALKKSFGTIPVREIILISRYILTR